MTFDRAPGVVKYHKGSPSPKIAQNSVRAYCLATMAIQLVKPEACGLVSDAGVCYDESEFCLQFANNGRCVNSALHKIANFCKKACGLCGRLSPTHHGEKTC